MNYRPIPKIRESQLARLILDRCLTMPIRRLPSMILLTCTKITPMISTLILVYGSRFQNRINFEKSFILFTPNYFMGKEKKPKNYTTKNET